MAIRMKPEQRAEVVQFYQAYAGELNESFHRGLLKELVPYPHFVVWQNRLVEGRYKKPPFNPKSHYPAEVDNPRTWGTLDQALNALATGYFHGIGFVFSPDDPFTGIDLDNCVGNNRSIDKWARDIIESQHTYTEYSPRNGIHLFLHASLPGAGRKVGNIELYSDKHYMTITTRHVRGTPLAVEKRSEELATIYTKLAPQFPQTQENMRGERVSLPLRTPISEHRGGVGSGQLDELPPEAANDRVLQRLLQGDMTGYESQSSADFVFIMKLLHWTGDNKILTRHLFLSSPLGQRQKAERPTGDTTYVDLTIENVLKKRRNPPMKR